MVDGVREPTEGDERLAEGLAALGNPVRLAILRELREPKILKEIEVAPHRDDAGDPQRPVTRQTVRTHLDRLADLGVVVAEEVERSFGTTVEYSLNHQALYSLGERFKRLARLRPQREPDVPTWEQDPREGYELETPCLALVKGLDEGRVFPLDPAGPGQRWVLGRRRGAEVVLDYDPFVSSENAVVRRRDGGFWIEDLPDSRNGTRLNFRPLPEGEPRPLSDGDAIGVGKSVLLFRDGEG